MYVGSCQPNPPGAFSLLEGAESGSETKSAMYSSSDEALHQFLAGEGLNIIYTIFYKIAQRGQKDPLSLHNWTSVH